MARVVALMIWELRAPGTSGPQRTGGRKRNCWAHMLARGRGVVQGLHLQFAHNLGMEERLRAQVPTVAAAFRDSCQLASDSLFEAPGFAMPATPRDGQHPGQYIKYSQVESFLAMAEQALRARDRAVDALRDETAALMSDLDNVRGEKSKVG